MLPSENCENCVSIKEMLKAYFRFCQLVGIALENALLATCVVCLQIDDLFNDHICGAFESKLTHTFSYYVHTQLNSMA